MGSYRVHLEVKCPQCGEVKTTRGVKGFRHCGRLHDVHQNLTQSGKQKYNKHRQYQKLYGDPDHERNQTNDTNESDREANNLRDNDTGTDSQNDSESTGVDKLNPDNVFTNDSQRQRQQQQQTRRGDNMTNEDNNDNEVDDNDNEDNHKYHCNSCGVGFDRKLYRCRQCGKRFAWDKVE